MRKKKVHSTVKNNNSASNCRRPKLSWDKILCEIGEMEQAEWWKKSRRKFVWCSLIIRARCIRTYGVRRSTRAHSAETHNSRTHTYINHLYDFRLLRFRAHSTKLHNSDDWQSSAMFFDETMTKTNRKTKNSKWKRGRKKKMTNYAIETLSYVFANS